MDAAAPMPPFPLPRRRPHWMAAVFGMELRKVLSYRADFWIQFLGSLVAQFGVAWFLWQAIYATRAVEQIGPFSFRGMMLYYLAAPLAAKIIQSSEIGHMSEEIYNGSLNRYLIYPVSFLRYKLAAGSAHAAVFLLQFVLVLALFATFAGVPPECRLTAGSVARAAPAIVLAAYLHFVMVSTIELVAFWADNVWSLIVITRYLTGLLGGAMIPLVLFPEWATRVLYLLPFPYFIAFPVETLLGIAPPDRWAGGMAILAAWAVVLTAGFHATWRRGQYRYNGVGI